MAHKIERTIRETLSVDRIFENGKITVNKLKDGKLIPEEVEVRRGEWIVTHHNGSQEILTNAETRLSDFEITDFAEPKSARVFAAGNSIKECIENFCRSRLGICEEVPHFTDNSDEKGYDWSAHFKMNGTNCKCAGIKIDGIYILTWWK